VEHQREVSRRLLLEAARREATRREHEALRLECRKIRVEEDSKREVAVDRSKRAVEEVHKRLRK
jgi:hypothetical protein